MLQIPSIDAKLNDILPPSKLSDLGNNLLGVWVLLVAFLL